MVRTLQGLTRTFYQNLRKVIFVFFNEKKLPSDIQTKIYMKFLVFKYLNFPESLAAREPCIIRELENPGVPPVFEYACHYIRIAFRF